MEPGSCTQLRAAEPCCGSRLHVAGFYSRTRADGYQDPATRPSPAVTTRMQRARPRFNFSITTRMIAAAPRSHSSRPRSNAICDVALPLKITTMNFASSITDCEPVATHSSFYSRCLNMRHNTLTGLHFYSRSQTTTRQTTFPLSWLCHFLNSQTNISNRSCLTVWRSCRLTLPRCERLLLGTKYRKLKTSTQSRVKTI